MKRARKICALLAVVVLSLPVAAAGEDAVRSHVRENFYPGPGSSAHFDAAHAEREAGLPRELSSIYASGPLPFRSSGPIMLGGGFSFNLEPRQSFFSPGVFDWHTEDLFSHRNIFQQVYDPSGMDGATLSYRFGNKTELSAFGAFDAGLGDQPEPEKLGPDRAYGVKLATRASVLDMAIRYTEAREDGVDANLSPEGVLIPVRWRLVSAGLSADFGGLGLRAEGGHAWSDAEADPEADPEGGDVAAAHSHFLVGLDYTFDNNLYLVLEYFQDGQADSGAGIDDRADRPAFLTGGGDAPSRDNYLVGARYPITDLTSIEFFNIVNDGDAAVMVNPWLILNAGDVFRLKLSAHIPFPKKDQPPEDAPAAAFGSIQLNF